MDITSLIAPWLTLLVILIPLIYAERWIHQHMFGVGYLLTLDKAQATGFYYLVFFPGVLVHEVIQWLIAGMLNVPIKKINSYPKPQEDGTIRYDFVVIEKTSRFRAILIGGLPFVIAGALVYFISTSVLQLDALLAAIGTGDLDQIGRGIKEFLKTGDVWLWLYFMFSISNGMIPTKEDRQGWFLILGAAAAITIAFLFLGFDVFVTKTMSGPVAHALQLVNTALLAILFIDIVFGLTLGLIEDGLARWRGQKMDYNTGRQLTKKGEPQREPGSNVPLPKGTPIPSIYRLDLPVPPLPTKRLAKPTPTSAAPAMPVRPAASPAPMFNRPTPTSEAGENKPTETPTARPTPSFSRPESKPAEQVPAPRPAFQPTPRPNLAEKPAESVVSEPPREKSETPAEQPATPARPPFQPTPRPTPSGDVSRAPSPAVAPFRRSGADENEGAVTRDQLLGRSLGRPNPSGSDSPSPSRTVPPGGRPENTDNPENSARIMGRKPPSNDSDEVQYVDIDDV
ncbi:MAG: hypothetical protein HY862_00360 [Chloroflexi bacterium]|nr:hypothetical protein [Chloroflexota bacterium]